MDPLRTRRVSEMMREELSELIRFEVSDPRVAQVDVTEVHVASDLRRADVLVSLPQDPQARDQAMQGLEHARNYLRRQLMQRLDVYRMPDLHFVSDRGAGGPGGAPTERLLRRARRGRPRAEENPSE